MSPFCYCAADFSTDDRNRSAQIMRLMNSVYPNKRGPVPLCRWVSEGGNNEQESYGRTDPARLPPARCRQLRLAHSDQIATFTLCSHSTKRKYNSSA